MPNLYVLVGVPGSGKSTWVNSQEWAKDCVYISTDKHIEQIASEAGLTYDDVFSDAITTATNMAHAEARQAALDGKDVIWDQTSVSVKSRKIKFRLLPNYYAIAVVFSTPDPDEHALRLANRPGKTIPDHAITKMIKSFQMPTEAEGFKEIWHI